MNRKPMAEMADRKRDNVRIGRTVRQYRLSRELTQDALAAKSGVSKTRISEIESGAGCSVYVLMCLCYELGASPLDVMAWRYWQGERERVRAPRGAR